MSWFRRRPTPAQTESEQQAAWSDLSRAIGEGQIPGRQGFAQVEEGFFQRLASVFRPVEQRAITSLPWSTGGTLPGPNSTPTVDGALALGAVYAAVSLLARTVAGLPLHAFREVDGKKTELNQLPALFDEPSVQGDLFDWLHRCITSLALYGNAYGLVTNRDGFGYPLGIEWMSPEHITVVDFAFTGPGSFLDPIWRWRGRTIPKENLVHLAWFTRPWKVQGLSPLAAYAAAVNTGLGAQQFSADWFTAGGVPPGTFKNAMKTVPREEAVEVKQRLVDSIRSHQPIVYGADWDYKPIGISPNEARFIETMKLTATQIAAIYGVPPERVGGEKGSSMTYSNTEQESIDFVQFTILNYTRKLETAFFKLLPARQYVRFNLDALIRTDLMTRHKTYLLDRQMGLRNIDEIRDMEDLPPLPNGEGESYAPLLTTGLAPEPGEEPTVPGAPGMMLMKPGGTSGPGAEDTPGALPQVINLPPRKPYNDTSPQGGRSNGWANGYRAAMVPDSPIHLTINNTMPERQFVMEHRAGDIIVHPSPAPEVRVELPVTFHPPDVRVPVSISTPDVRISSPVTVNTPEVHIPVTVHGDTVNVEPAVVSVPVNVQAANAPDVHIPVTVQAANAPAVQVPVTVQAASAPQVHVPVTVQPAAAPTVTFEAPITVNSPDVQVRSPDVYVQPAVINVAMPKPESPPDVEVLDGTGKVISRTRRIKK
jgi:HK97 family phage portal protein